MDPTQVIIRPVVSEKSYVLAANDKYTFRVHPDAHKTQIRQAVEQLFEVKVLEVRTITVRSKPKLETKEQQELERALAPLVKRQDELIRQAKALAEKLFAQGGPKNMEDKEVVALIAYLQRLGKGAAK